MPKFLILPIMALLLTLHVASAWAQSVTSIALIPDGAQTQIRITTEVVDTPPKIFVIDEDKASGKGARLVIDWVNAQATFGGHAGEAGQKYLGGRHHVAGLRHARRGNSGLRLVLDLVPGADLKSKSVDAKTIALTIAGSKLKAQPTRLDAADLNGLSVKTPSVQAEETSRIPIPRLQPSRQYAKKPTRRPVIVIDAGHGGRDPGALGRGGTREKDITSKASAELKTQLEATGRYTVLLTRSGDIYVDHAERLRIARAGGADLFISVHADATKGPTARGASVYTIADRAKNRSRKITDTQNWIMDVDLAEQSDPVGNILVDLAQRKTFSQSEQFADILVRKLKGSTQMVRNSHRRAGYFVLLAPDVPAVLLELGFLSNREDEKLLNKASHRRKLMRSVTGAINTYFDDQKT